MPSMEETFLESFRVRFRGQKDLGDRALAQVMLEDIQWSPDADANSIAIIVEHLRGNMLSRWTDFLTSDGEKPWRERDAEFESPPVTSRDEVIARWNEGWACALDAADALSRDDLTRTVVIRGRTLGVIDALLRQLAHAAYHVGQIVYLARWRRGAEWQTLSIARGTSRQYIPSKRD